MTWTPTAENINALEPGLREYIHRLEANTDPAGEVRRAMIAEMQLAAVNRMLEEAPVGTVAMIVGKYGRACDVYFNAPLPPGIKGKRVRLVVVDE